MILATMENSTSNWQNKTFINTTSNVWKLINNWVRTIKSNNSLLITRSARRFYAERRGSYLIACLRQRLMKSNFWNQVLKAVHQQLIFHIQPMYKPSRLSIFQMRKHTRGVVRSRVYLCRSSIQIERTSIMPLWIQWKMEDLKCLSKEKISIWFGQDILRYLTYFL